MKESVKKFCRDISIFIKENYVKFLKHLVLIVILFGISIYFILKFPKSTESIIGIFTWIIIVYIIMIYFYFAPIYMEKKEISSLESRLNKNSKRSLYEWLGNISFHDITIYKWLMEDEKKDIAVNLKNIKKGIISNVGDSISDYYLLKIYLEYHGKNNFLNSVWKTGGTIFIGGLGGLLIKIGIVDQLYNAFTSEAIQTDVFRSTEIIVQIGVITLVLLIIVLFFRSEFTKEKRRIDLLSYIVDVIIKEKEDSE